MAAKLREIIRINNGKLLTLLTLSRIYFYYPTYRLLKKSQPPGKKGQEVAQRKTPKGII